MVKIILNVRKTSTKVVDDADDYPAFDDSESNEHRKAIESEDDMRKMPRQKPKQSKKRKTGDGAADAPPSKRVMSEKRGSKRPVRTPRIQTSNREVTDRSEVSDLDEVVAALDESSSRKKAWIPSDWIEQLYRSTDQTTQGPAVREAVQQWLSFEHAESTEDMLEFLDSAEPEWASHDPLVDEIWNEVVPRVASICGASKGNFVKSSGPRTATGYHPAALSYVFHLEKGVRDDLGQLES
jgi:hypothetical protein